MDTKIFSREGKEAGKMTLPDAVFATTWKPDLVHQVVVSIQSNARAGTAHTKDRSEVRGGGRKPWRQKGTGRARHGSRRSPIWTGGGVTFGPRNEKDYGKKINKNMKAAALASTLSKKVDDGELILVEDFSFDAPKTAEAKNIVTNLAKGANVDALLTKRKNTALVVLAGRNENVEKSFANFSNYAVMQAKDISVLDLLTYKYVVVVNPDVSIETLVKRASKKNVKTTA